MNTFRVASREEKQTPRGVKYFTFDRAGVIENARYSMQSLQVTRSEEKCVQKMSSVYRCVSIVWPSVGGDKLRSQALLNWRFLHNMPAGLAHNLRRNRRSPEAE